MNFQQLEYLKVLVQQGNFSQAAQTLHLTQPALSLQIGKLEEELGFQILDRRKRPVQLTSEGEVFFHKAIEILKMVNDLKQVAFDLGEEIKGELKIGIIPTLAPYLVPLFIDKLNADFPGLGIEVTEQKTEGIIRHLKLGTYDCGILSTPVDAKGITFEPLFFEQFFAYVSEKHPQFYREEIDMDELMDADIWYLEEGNCFQNQVNSICKINLQKKTSQNLIYRSNSIESLRRIVENRNGITFIPELATINISPEQEEMVKTIRGSHPMREISIATAGKNPKARQIGILKTAISQSIPKRMQKQPEGWVVNTHIRI